MELNLIIQSDRWSGEELDWERLVTLVFAAHEGIEEDRAIALVLSDDEQVQELNRDYRGKDKPTNVLSFPSDEPDEWGDIILSYQTIAREAAAQGKSFQDHTTHLLLHGVLHLLGYDHENPEEAEEMESLETALLSQLAIANPYEKD